MNRYFFFLLFLGITIIITPSLQAQSADGLHPPIEPYKSGYLKVSDLHEIYYECCGNPEGSPVLCLHGGPGAGCYPRMRQYFNAEKYNIVLHDQRGAQRSKPMGELKENTTQNLVEDIERLRKHLELGKVLIFGGSWGSTLGLAYAEKYPDNVRAMILRGVFLGTEEELNFHYIGTRFFFPKEHDALLSLLPDKSRNTHPDYIYKLIKGDDKELGMKVLKALGRFEIKFMKLNMPDEYVNGFLNSIPEDVHENMQASIFITLPTGISWRMGNFLKTPTN